MIWKNNWPVMGSDKDGDGKGEPVLVYKKPDVGKTYPIETPVESDEFNGRHPACNGSGWLTRRPIGII
ncbi:hypothetical protein ACFJIV_16025 [Mucilaginibacter sp. UC70_90]